MNVSTSASEPRHLVEDAVTIHQYKHNNTSMSRTLHSQHKQVYEHKCHSDLQNKQCGINTQQQMSSQVTSASTLLLKRNDNSVPAIAL